MTSTVHAGWPARRIRVCVCLRTSHEPTVTPCPAGHQLLLPLTQSLYVNGTIAQPDKVMIDIGTGYFVEV